MIHCAPLDVRPPEYVRDIKHSVYFRYARWYLVEVGYYRNAFFVSVEILKINNDSMLETSLICILLSTSRDVHFDKRMISGLL